MKSNNLYLILGAVALYYFMGKRKSGMYINGVYYQNPCFDAAGNPYEYDMPGPCPVPQQPGDAGFVGPVRQMYVGDVWNPDSTQMQA